MASAAEGRRLAVILVLIALLSACGTDPSGSAAPQSASAAPTDSAPSVTPSPSPHASPTASVPDGLALPEPARPFDPETLLDAMRTSRRPGGVPDQLETDAIATAVAEEIWTYGGEPWTTMAIGGSCGPQTCTLEVAGSRPDSLGEDLWVFEIVPNGGNVTLASATLAALPNELVQPLDGLARMLLESDQLGGLILASAHWLPPPATGQFALSYRSGGEEGSCRIDLILDAAAAEVIEQMALDC